MKMKQLLFLASLSIISLWLSNCNKPEEEIEYSFFVQKIVPDSGVEGDTIKIIGKNFISDPTAISVLFGEVFTPVIFSSDSIIIAKVPVGASSDFIKVQIKNKSVKSPLFSIQPSFIHESIIKNITPESNTTILNFLPVIAINLKSPIDQPITSTTSSQTLKPVFDFFKIYDQTNQIEITGILQWNDTKDKLSFLSQSYLLPNSTFKIEAQFHWEEKKESGWIPLKSGQKELKEQILIYFSTGGYTLPDVILKDNIQYTYPINRQFCFFKSEYPIGYIALKANQPNIFNLQEEGKMWSLKARFISLNLDSIDVDAVYKQESLTLEFPIPATLQNEKIYSLTIVKIPTTGKEKILHRQFFRTSKYNTFIDKATAMLSLKGSWSWALFAGVHKIGTNTAREECFDKFEMESGELKVYDQTVYIQTGLIQFEAMLQDNIWYKEYLYPLCYKIHETTSMKIRWRDSQPFGIPPAQPVSISESDYSNKFLTDEEISTNTPEITANKFYASIFHTLELIAYYDYQDVQQQIANYKGNDLDPELIKKILSTVFLPMKSKTDCFIKMKYVLPGIKKVSSEKIINIFVP